jgi:hypothetical protein
MKTNFILYFLLIFNLATLTISPIPWNDEIYFADLSMSLAQQQGLINTILPIDNPPFVYIYGPIYFYIQALLIKLFGLKIFLFRFVNFISSIGILWVLYRYFRVNKLLILLLAISPLFIQNAHSGRMDLFATFFALVGYVPFSKNNNVTFYKISILSFFFLLAFLTSPRVAFLFPGVYVFLFSKFSLKWRDVSLMIIPIITVFAGLIAWSLNTTGSLFGAYLPIFQSNIAQSSEMHMGISFIRGHIDDLISLFFLFFGVIYYLKYRNLVVLSMLVNYLLFSIFVKEVGPYGAMVLPFIILGISQIDFSNIYFRASFILILSIFSFYFLGKTVILLGSISSRNHNNLDNFIKSNIPSGEKVFATNEYYYSLLNNNNSPVMIQFVSKETESFILKEKPKYLLLNFQFYKSKKIDYLLGKLKYKKIGTINENNLGDIKLFQKYNLVSGLNGILLEKI